MQNDLGSRDTAFPFFRSRPARILSEGDVDSAVKTTVARTTGLIDKWVQNGSDWTVSRVRQLDVLTAKYTPLRGEFLFIRQFLFEACRISCGMNLSQMYFYFILFFFYYVHITSSKRIRKDNGTETRTNVTTNEQALHRDAAVMVGH